nr:hypothetical protein [Tanacetum cinerariifolium]
MTESSSHNSSSHEITPKEEPVTLDKPESPKPFLPATQDTAGRLGQKELSKRVVFLPGEVVGEMHKGAHQAAGGPTSLGATSIEGAYPQLNSGSNPSVLVDETKSAGDGLKTTHTDSEFLDLPSHVSSVQEMLKALDSLPSLLNKVTETLHRFASVVEIASGATTADVPSAGQATASPAEGEKNTKDAETNLKYELV